MSRKPNMFDAEFWRGVQGKYKFYCGLYEGVIEDSSGQPVPQFFSDAIKTLFPDMQEGSEFFEVVVKFVSDGHDDAGCYDYPATSKDERYLDGLVEIHYSPLQIVKELTQEQSQQCFDYCREKIKKVDIVD